MFDQNGYQMVDDGITDVADDTTDTTDDITDTTGDTPTTRILDEIVDPTLNYTLDNGEVYSLYMDHLLEITVLEDYTLTISNCQLSTNWLRISPLLITDQSSIAYSGTPAVTSFTLQNSNFTSNMGLTDSGSFKIMNNPWIISEFTG